MVWANKAKRWLSGPLVNQRNPARYETYPVADLDFQNPLHYHIHQHPVVDTEMHAYQYVQAKCIRLMKVRSRKRFEWIGLYDALWIVSVANMMKTITLAFATVD